MQEPAADVVSDFSPSLIMFLATFGSLPLAESPRGQESQSGAAEAPPHDRFLLTPHAGYEIGG